MPLRLIALLQQLLAPGSINGSAIQQVGCPKIANGGEAALLFRSPNAGLPERCVGYSVGLSPDGDWIYDPNAIHHYVFMMAGLPKISDANKRAVVDPQAWTRLEVEAVGVQMIVRFNGIESHRLQDARYPDGQVGIHTRKAGIEIRRFEYQSLKP